MGFWVLQVDTMKTGIKRCTRHNQHSATVHRHQTEVYSNCEISCFASRSVFLSTRNRDFIAFEGCSFTFNYVHIGGFACLPRSANENSFKKPSLIMRTS